MLSKYTLLSFVLLISLLSAMSAETQLKVENITSREGLSNNTVRCILQDKSGFIWFGTLNGLNKFDGSKIKTFVPNAINPTSLSTGKIKEIHQDSHGYIWVRTYGDMMHCYDPQTENFIALFENKHDQGIKHNLFYEDKEQNIWLGSADDGCVMLNINNNHVKTTPYSTHSEQKLSSNTVNDIYQDRKLKVWIATKNGINLIQKGQTIAIKSDNRNYLKIHELNKNIFFVTADGKIVKYTDLNKLSIIAALPQGITVNQTASFKDSGIILTTNNNGVFIFNSNNGTIERSDKYTGEFIGGTASLQTDKAGNVWLHNMSGNVWLFSPKQTTATKLCLMPPANMKLIDEERYQFLPDNHNNIWITTYGNGLFCYNYQKGITAHYTYQKDDKSINSNYLLSIAIDKENNLWIGTESMGIDKLSYNERNSQIHYPDPESVIRNGNTVKAFLEDRKGNIWVSTKSGSLFCYSPDFKAKKTVISNGPNVYNMYEDKAGTIWLGTRRNGLYMLPEGSLSKSKNFTNNGTPGCLSNNTVFSVIKDNKGRLWAATFGGGVCVNTSPETSDKFKTFFNDDQWIRFTRYVLQARNGDIWVATTSGVLRFNPDALLRNPKAYRYYNFDVESQNCLSNPEVRQIYQDKKGSIWLATAAGGLNRFIGENNKGNGVFVAYPNKQGLAANNIVAIQEDKSGNIWISTENGLHKLNSKSRLFKYYKLSDDFSSNIFSETACTTLRNGMMLWGSLNGFYTLNPDNIDIQTRKNNHVTLTGFSIYDQDAKIGTENAPLNRSVSFSDKITLHSTDKVFHIEFSNLDFKDPKENQFVYMLDNYEKRWNLSGALNSATYRNVPPGKYTFMIRSLDTDGSWSNETTSLEIEILPPFWQSNLAIFIYLLILTALGYVAYKLIIKFYRLNNAVKVERQLTDYKLRFFTNISHEFRTPLTLIKGSVDSLVDIKNKMSEPLQHTVNDLEKNTAHLLRLIDQLMEFRKLQNNKQKLNLQKTDAISFLKDIYNSFTNVASKSNIEYNFINSSENIELYLDRNKVDKIVFNLLSNAFKFTPRGGKISLITEINSGNNSLKIAVADNGIGIPKEKQDMLFSRFMQINFSSNGTGVGLSLVNEFTLLHKGKVGFHDNEGGGSVFSVELPLNSDIYSTEDFVTEEIVVTNKNNKEVYKINEFIEMENGADELLNLLPNAPRLGEKYKILVIDDNDDIRDFLLNKLSPYYDVITAEDGEIGIQKSMNDDPDLIICDVMMPGMNGFELTKKLKDDFATCHIPVILLTAYVSDSHNTEGIQAGADAYISKPFSMPHLLIQVNKLIEKRELLHKHYASNESTDMLKTEDPPIELPDRDEHFLKLVEELLEKHLTNPEFSVDEFAQLTNTGRTLFFKKIKYLTGYSPNEFIRYRRMTKAAELLRTYKYNVSEVSYMVGINDPFYFSKCFKAQFGCSPSKFLNTKQ